MATSEEPSRDAAELIESVRIEQLDLDEVSDEVLGELESLLNQAYHNGHMYPDLLADIERRPEIFQLFLARTDGQIAGVRVVETKRYEEVDYLGLLPVHGKRFTVHPDYRGQGIGKRIVDAGKQYCFEELDLQALFGQSGEAGALAMYGREGAMYHLESILGQTHKWTPEQHLIFFREFITNPVFKKNGYRFPTGTDINFAYVRDKETARLFRRNGYVSMAELLDS